jgi:hypothetical protein
MFKGIVNARKEGIERHQWNLHDFFRYTIAGVGSLKGLRSLNRENRFNVEGEKRSSVLRGCGGGHYQNVSTQAYPPFPAHPCTLYPKTTYMYRIHPDHDKISFR